MNKPAVVSKFAHVKPGDMKYFKNLDVPLGRQQGAVSDTVEVIAMSSPEELTFAVGRWLRPIVVMLDVVRRLGLRTTSSREQRSTVPNQ